MVFPSLDLSVVIEPSPNFLVWEEVPSERLVDVPSPNLLVTDVLDFGSGSAPWHIPNTKT